MNEERRKKKEEEEEGKKRRGKEERRKKKENKIDQDVPAPPTRRVWRPTVARLFMIKVIRCESELCTMRFMKGVCPGPEPIGTCLIG